MRSDLFRYGRRCPGIRSEYDAAFFDIGTGNIDFQPGYAIDIECFGQPAVFFS